MELNEVRAAVVGGASGMARAAAERIVAGGGRVAIMDRPGSGGDEVAKQLGSAFVECDVTEFTEFEFALGSAVEALDGLNVTLNTAGGGRPGRTVGRDGPLPLEDFRAVVDLNLVASFNVARLAAWRMTQNTPNEDGERGVILHTSSIAAFEGQIGQVAYSASKAAIAGMCLTMARDLGSLGIRVNAIAPSLFQTGITSGIPDDFASKLTADAAFPKRMGRPDEFGRLAVAIIENPMMNGSCVRLDAGQRFGPK
jgi:NAD(P)-dependent dehydrogenase (short-subunit alcohol dehydrogenase family)